MDKGKPDVGHFCVFGCDSFAHVPKDERKKLDSKSRKCILVGYGEETKGYRLYDSQRAAKIIFSRDVVFNESDGRASTEHETREREGYVELDISVNDPKLSDDVLDQPEPAEPVPDESNSDSHCRTFVIRLDPRNSQTTMAGAHILLQNPSQASFKK